MVSDKNIIAELIEIINSERSLDKIKDLIDYLDIHRLNMQFNEDINYDSLDSAYDELLMLYNRMQDQKFWGVVEFSQFEEWQSQHQKILHLL